MYDNTKLNKAFKAWLDQNVELGFGNEYVGDMLDDFCDFLEDTKMLRKSPGRVVFGQLLHAHKKLDRNKRLGLTYYSGIKLKRPRVSKPKRYEKTRQAEADEARRRVRLRREDEEAETPEGRKDRLKQFQADMKEEDRKREALLDENMQDL